MVLGLVRVIGQVRKLCVVKQWVAVQWVGQGRAASAQVAQLRGAFHHLFELYELGLEFEIVVSRPELLPEVVSVHVEALLATAHPVVVVDALRSEERGSLLLGEAWLEGSCGQRRVSVEGYVLAQREVVEALAVYAVIVLCGEGHGRVEGVRMVRLDGLRLGVAVALVGRHGDRWLGHVETGGRAGRLLGATELRSVLVLCGPCWHRALGR